MSGWAVRSVRVCRWKGHVSRRPWGYADVGERESCAFQYRPDPTTSGSKHPISDEKATQKTEESRHLDRGGRRGFAYGVGLAIEIHRGAELRAKVSGG